LLVLVLLVFFRVVDDFALTVFDVIGDGLVVREDDVDRVFRGVDGLELSVELIQPLQ
jgi:hypothetical protein